MFINDLNFQEIATEDVNGAGGVIIGVLSSGFGIAQDKLVLSTLTLFGGSSAVGNKQGFAISAGALYLDVAD